MLSHFVAPAILLASFIASTPFQTDAIKLLPLGHDQETLNGRLAIGLVAEKQDYISGEMIFLEDTLENLTNDVLRIPHHNHWTQLEIHMEDAFGTRVQCLKPVTTTFGPRSQDTLRPREKSVRVVPLTECGNMDGWTGAARNLAPGTYKVWIELGGIESNSVELHIKPVPTSELEVQRVLMEFEDSFAGPKIDYDVQIARLEEMLTTHQKSVFAPNIYSGLISRLYVRHRDRNADAEKLLRAAPVFLSRYANLADADRVLQQYRVVLETSLGLHERKPIERHKVELLVEMIRALKTRCPGTRLERYIEEEVSRIEQRYKKK